jgi:hypothetical protein
MLAAAALAATTAVRLREQQRKQLNACSTAGCPLMLYVDWDGHDSSSSSSCCCLANKVVYSRKCMGCFVIVFLRFSSCGGWPA